MNTNERVILRLSVNAMNALFPEGTEARVELQNSVLEQAARQFVKGQLLPEVQQHLESVVSKVASGIDYEYMIRQSFAKKSGWSEELNVVPSGAVGQAIATRVRDEFQERLATAIEEGVSALVAKTRADLEETIEYHVQGKVKRITEKMIKDRVDAAFAAAGLAVVP